MGLDARLRLARLYLITDARTKQGDLAEFLKAAFAGGVDIVQIREKGMAPEAELEVLEVARNAAMPYQSIVCVNDSAALAGRFHADMLHLGQADGPSAPARAQLHPWAILGRSTHTLQEIDAAITDKDVDYLTVGPVYATSLHPEYPPIGLEPVRYLARLSPVFEISAKPWFAVGGINLDTIDEVIAAGARRVCCGQRDHQGLGPSAGCAAAATPRCRRPGTRTRQRSATHAGARVDRPDALRTSGSSNP